MKDAEDEAFDEIARKQGAWGGGFPAKRKMTMDKIHAEFYEKYVKYRTAFPKEYTAPQPAQEPVQRPWVGLTDEEIAQGNKESWVTKQAWESAVWWASEKLKEKNNG